MKYINEISLRNHAFRLLMVFVSLLSLVGCGGGGAGSAVVVAKLFWSAPSAVTVAIGASPTYTIGGGVAPYLVSSSSAGVATASVSGTTLTINGVSQGSALITVTDSTGSSSLSTTVTIGSGTVSTTLFLSLIHI